MDGDQSVSPESNTGMEEARTQTETANPNMAEAEILKPDTKPCKAVGGPRERKTCHWLSSCGG